MKKKLQKKFCEHLLKRNQEKLDKKRAILKRKNKYTKDKILRINYILFIYT